MVAEIYLSGGRRFRRLAETILHHHLGDSGFSEFTATARESLVKVDSDVPLEIAVLFGCGVISGVGAVVNTAKVIPGTLVAIFGLGVVERRPRSKPWAVPKCSFKVTPRPYAEGKTVAVGLPRPDQQLSIQVVSVTTEERRLLGS